MRNFYGWRVVGAAFVLAIFGWGLGFYGPPVYLHAVREQGVVFSVIGDQAGGQTFDLWSPKLGLLWDVDPGWQVFANASKSAEIPSFGENQIGNPVLTGPPQRRLPG